MSDESFAVGTGLATAAEPPPSSCFGWSDWAGVAASIACAIHCAAMPLAIGYLPALGLDFLADEAFHRWMAGGCFAIALAAFVPGFRQHRRFAPAIFGAVGLVIISVAACGVAGECCVACDSASASAAGPSSVAVLAAGTCTEACCLRDTEASETVAPGAMDAAFPAAPSAVVSPWIDRIAPLLTPLGGLFLVGGHLLNRRCGCRCGVGHPSSAGSRRI